MSEKTADYADLYFQHSSAESWVLDEGIVKEGSYRINHGVGLRSVKGEQTGFAYSDDLNIKAIEQAARFAKSITHGKSSKIAKPFSSIVYTSVYTGLNPLGSLNPKEKVDLLINIDKLARKEPKVKQVNASLSGAYTEILVASTDGTYQLDYRPMVRINVSVIVEHEGRVERASSGGGGRYDYRYFIDHGLTQFYVD